MVNPFDTTRVVELTWVYSGSPVTEWEFRVKPRSHFESEHGTGFSKWFRLFDFSNLASDIAARRRPPPLAPGGRSYRVYLNAVFSAETGLVTHPRDGVQYTFQLRALNGDVVGALSNEVAAWVAPKPAAPTNLTATPGNQSLRLQWDDPDNPKILRYEYGIGADGDWQAIPGSTSGTVSHTLTGLDNGKNYQVWLRAVNISGFGTSKVSGTPADRPPVLPPAASFPVAENTTAVGTVAAGDPDDGDSVTGYAITGGADRAKFSITDAGVLAFKTAPDYENPQDVASTTPANAAGNNEYLVEVTVTSGADGRTLTAVQAITVTVTNVDEKPMTPSAPTFLIAEDRGTVVVTANWAAPVNLGPPITGYKVQYRTRSAGGAWSAWRAGTHSGTNPAWELPAIPAGEEAEVQVRAVNAEGEGPWSSSGSVTIVQQANAPPAFDGPAVFSVAENTTAVGTVAATDADDDDSVTGYAVTGGADQALFSIDASSGALTFKAAPDYETAADADMDNVYVVVVTATSGAGSRELTAARTITVTVTDVDESMPAAPRLSARQVLSLDNVFSTTRVVELTWDYSGSPVTGWEFRVKPRSHFESEHGTGFSKWFRLFDFSDIQSNLDAGRRPPPLAPGGRSYRVYLNPVFSAEPGLVTHPRDGVQYTFQLRALNGEVVGALSSEVAAWVAPKPSAPTNLTATPGNQSLRLQWDDPDNPKILRYEYGIGADGDYQAIPGSTSGTVSHTLTGLDNGKNYQVWLRAVNISGFGTSKVSGTPADRPPVLPPAASFPVAENTTAVGTVAAGDPDDGDSVTGYAITGGADRAKFSITDAGVLAFKTAPDYENPQDVASTTPANAAGNNEYLVEVTVTSGADGRALTATQAITVTVTDVDEKPGSVGPLTFQITEGRTPQNVVTLDLRVIWTKPRSLGGAITGYDVEWRIRRGGSWTTSTWIQSPNRPANPTYWPQFLRVRDVGDLYRVRVRAINRVGKGPWSQGESTILRDPNVPPVFSGSATLPVAENTAAVGTVAATDADASDSITGYAVTGGADQAAFSIDAGTGALSFKAAPDFEAPTDAASDHPSNAAGNNEYLVEVTATSGATARELTAIRRLTVTVTDVDEPPSAPSPNISRVRLTSFTVGWSAPVNTGPAVTGYEVQYRVSGTTAWTDAGHSGTAKTVELTGLQAGTAYEVQVRATNEEGMGAWSASATATTSATCMAGSPAVRGYTGAGIVEDCNILLRSKDALRGRGLLNWSAATAMADWDGTIDVVGNRVANLSLTSQGLTGSIPADLSGLTGLTRLNLSNNRLSGSIPSGLSSLTGLTRLDLSGNELSGSIPPGLSRLTGLTWLDLSDNDLSGSIPPGLIGLTRLTGLVLRNNRLDGCVPMAWSRFTSTINPQQDAVNLLVCIGPGVTVTPTRLPVPEGGRATYTVALNALPTGTVTVTPTATGDSDISVSGALTFTTGNWNTAQTVTVSAAADDDAAAGTATIAHTASGGGYDSVTIAPVMATEDDNDTAGVTLDPETLSVTEESTDTYTVVLDTLPTGPVTVSVAKQSGGDDDLTVSPATLTFTTDDWSTAQTVTVSAADDADTDDGTATFTHSASGADYGSVVIDSVKATESDNDMPGVTVDPETLSVTEESTDTYTVVLDTLPTGPVTVSVAKQSGGDDDLTVSPTALTFTTGNWNTAQTVTVSAADDADTDDGAATFTHSASGGDYGSVVIDSVKATESDNDMPGVTVDPETLSVTEESTDTYTVVLDTLPTGPVTVSVAKQSGGDDDLTVSPTALTFTTDDWSTAQTVTVSAAADDDTAAGTATFTHSASGGGYDDVTIASVSATEADDDMAGVSVSESRLPVPEGGSASYTVALDTPPTAAVEIAVAKQSEGDADLTVSPAALTFTTADWNTPQTVTVSAAADADTTAGTATITHTATSTDSAYTGLTIASVTATETDNNAAPAFNSDATFSVAEHTTPVGTVAATDADTADSVTGYTISGGADQALFSIVAGTGVLTFKTAPNFEAPTDAASTDPANDAENNEYIVEVTATGGAGNRTLTTAQTLTVTVTDDETEAPAAPAAPTISAETATGFTATWTAPENAGPAITNYAVQYREGTSGTWTSASHSGTTLTVTLTGLNPATAYQVQVQATNAEGTSAWSAAATGTTTAAAGVTVSESTLTVNEGGSATYTVVLDIEPHGGGGNRRGEGSGRRRGPDGRAVFADLQHLKLEHGADGDGERGSRCRRRRWHGHPSRTRRPARTAPMKVLTLPR